MCHRSYVIYILQYYYIILSWTDRWNYEEESDYFESKIWDYEVLSNIAFRISDQTADSVQI